MICPHCGKIFTMLVAKDKVLYEKHVQLHEMGSCGCEGVGKIDTINGKLGGGGDDRLGDNLGVN